MMARLAALVAVVLLLLALAPQAALACSSFAFDCGDGAVVHVRTMDFEQDMIGASSELSCGAACLPSPC